MKSDSAVKLFFPLNRTQVPRQKESNVKKSLADIDITTTQFANDVSHKYWKNYVIAGVQLTSRAKMLSILDRSAPCFYLFLVLWLLRISLDCVMVKQLKRNTNWCKRNQP